MPWPCLNSGAVAGIAHGDVVYHDVFDNVHLPFVLAERPNRYTVATAADETLNQNINTTGLERDTIISIFDSTVLDDNVTAPECAGRLTC